MATAAAPPQKWQLNPSKTKVNFEVSYLKNAIIKGKFKKMEGLLIMMKPNLKILKYALPSILIVLILTLSRVTTLFVEKSC